MQGQLRLVRSILPLLVRHELRRGEVRVEARFVKGGAAERGEAALCAEATALADSMIDGLSAQVDTLVDEVFVQLDVERNGRISLEQWRAAWESLTLTLTLTLTLALTLALAPALALTLTLTLTRRAAWESARACPGVRSRPARTVLHRASRALGSQSTCCNPPSGPPERAPPLHAPAPSLPLSPTQATRRSPR